LVEVLTGTPGVAPYFDLSFQHASAAVLRRMRRFGDTQRFLELIESIRSREPSAGIRTNVIVGFPGETEADVAELERFLAAARLDAVGVFGYSEEEGTEAAGFVDKVAEAEIRDRVERVTRLVEQLIEDRAADRIGERVTVLVESVDSGEYPGSAQFGPARGEGRAAHQAPEVDGGVVLIGAAAPVGSLVACEVVGSFGVDLVGRTIDAEAADPAVALAG
jgi:tRNA A37 methylthiotransferase MiaB